MSSPLTESLTAAGPVFSALDALHVSYYIGGSLASSAWGVARSTIDADIVAALQPGHAEPFHQLLGDAYYADLQSIQEGIQQRRCFNLIHLALMHKIDIFPQSTALDREAMRRRRFEQLVQGEQDTKLPIASAEDIVLNKLLWFRKGDERSERQWQDVVNVMKVQAGVLDDAYIDRWATDLGIFDLIRRAREVSRG